MALPPKTPPRFVPTLTEVVQFPDTGLAPPDDGAWVREAAAAYAERERVLSEKKTKAA